MVMSWSSEFAKIEKGKHAPLPSETMCPTFFVKLTNSSILVSVPTLGRKKPSSSKNRSRLPLPVHVRSHDLLGDSLTARRWHPLPKQEGALLYKEKLSPEFILYDRRKARRLGVWRHKCEKWVLPLSTIKSRSSPSLFEISTRKASKNHHLAISLSCCHPFSFFFWLMLITCEKCCQPPGTP